MGQWKSLHLQITIMVLSYACIRYFHCSVPLSLSFPLMPRCVRTPAISSFKTTFCLCCQAGLLGCEAVLSSMALMQANNIPGQKKMMSPLGQGQRTSPESHQTHSQHSQNHHSHQVHHGQAHHSHMGHPSTGSCPPLVRDASLFCKEK